MVFLIHAPTGRFSVAVDAWRSSVHKGYTAISAHSIEKLELALDNSRF